MKGYKVFNPDWTCLGYQYKVGGTYTIKESPVSCVRGFHFCENLADCFSYYDFDPNNKVAEIEAVGDVVSGDNGKSCTNMITVVRELTWEEVLRTVNTGKSCTGLRNSGDYNSGNKNSGDYNSGNRNSGAFNSGDWNRGDRNSGAFNSGNYNSGDCNNGNWNSGDWNNGDWNSGDWNTTSFSAGCFCTEEPKILLFNRPSNWTLRDWRNSDARDLLYQIPRDVVKWIYAKEMTDEEKEAHPEHKAIGGYLKVLDESGNAQNWWNGLRDDQKEIIRNIPNFDPDIFRKCTGIDVGPVSMTPDADRKKKGRNENEKRKE